MKRLTSIKTREAQLEVGECNCGYHFGIDSTFLEQVKDFVFTCPSCKISINTKVLFSE